MAWKFGLQEIDDQHPGQVVEGPRSQRVHIRPCYFYGSIIQAFCRRRGILDHTWPLLGFADSNRLI